MKYYQTQCVLLIVLRVLCKLSFYLLLLFYKTMSIRMIRITSVNCKPRYLLSSCLNKLINVLEVVYKYLKIYYLHELLEVLLIIIINMSINSNL